MNLLGRRRRVAAAALGLEQEREEGPHPVLRDEHARQLFALVQQLQRPRQVFLHDPGCWVVGCGDDEAWSVNKR